MGTIDSDRYHGIFQPLRGFFLVFYHCIPFLTTTSALGLLHYLVNLGPSQKVRTQCLIPDALGQPLDERRCLTKRDTRLLSLPGCFI